MKFDIEIAYTQEIIMSYISFENFSKKVGPRGKTRFPSPPPDQFFFKAVWRTYRKIYD